MTGPPVFLLAPWKDAGFSAGCNQVTSKFLEQAGLWWALGVSGHRLSTKTKSLGRLVPCGCRDKCAYIQMCIYPNVHTSTTEVLAGSFPFETLGEGRGWGGVENALAALLTTLSLLDF